MNEHDFYNEEALNLIRELEENPQANQRALSRKLDVSLGKINYLLKALTKKGIIKIERFSRLPQMNKRRAVRYLLTKKGLKEKVALTYHFLQLKEREYERLKEQFNRYMAEVGERRA